MTKQQLLSKRRAAAEARVSPQTVEKWIRLGDIRPIQDGKRWKIQRSELEAVAGPTAESLLREFLQEIHDLRQENGVLRERLIRLEKAVFTTADDSASFASPAPVHLPLVPRARTKSEIAQLIVRHSQGTILFNTVMRWFNASLPCPMDPVDALRYAKEHCAKVGHRGRGQMVTMCADQLCICRSVLASEDLPANYALAPK